MARKSGALDTEAVSSFDEDHEDARPTVAAANSAADVRSAIQLGNEARDTLGYLPFVVYEEAARRKQLVIAVSGSTVVGYALFQRARGRIRLVHLVVAQRARGTGIARLLVEWISAQQSDALGIAVSCRHDYGLSRLWSSLGFTRVGERPGRSRQPTVLVTWWKDHGHPGFFNSALPDAAIVGSVDLNILRDLTDPARTGSEDANALVSDYAGARVELVRTAALDVEIDGTREPLRARLTRAAEPFRSIHPPRSAVQGIRDQLRVAGTAGNAGDPSAEVDVGYVAEAIAAGVNVFITRDRRLAETLGPAAASLGLRILSPSDVVVRLDELERAAAYRPVALQQTAFTTSLVKSGDPAIAQFAASRLGESRATFEAISRKLALSGATRLLVAAPDGRSLALICYESGPQLVVTLLRVDADALAPTIARQSSMLLKDVARRQGLAVIRVVDSFLSSTIRNALLDDGFVPNGTEIACLVVDVAGPSHEVFSAAVSASRQAGLAEPPFITPGATATAAGELERVWWPAKLLDSHLETYLVPIRPVYSTELLGVPRGLFGRSDSLGLSREQVYFRSPLGLHFQAPARILWYQSASRSSRRDAGVVAVSRLISVQLGSPDDLAATYSHLGVWTVDRLTRASRNGVIQALVFGDTEVFRSVVPLSAIAPNARPPQGPQRISAAEFGRAYRAGRRRD